MTVPDNDLASFPSCDQCGGHEERIRKVEKHGCDREVSGVGPTRLPEGLCQYEGRAASQARADPRFTLQHAAHPGPPVRDHQPFYEWDPMNGQRKGLTGPSDWDLGCSFEEAESLEPPLPLMSNINWVHHNVLQHQARMPGQWNCSIFNMMSTLTVRVNTEHLYLLKNLLFTPLFNPLL